VRGFALARDYAIDPSVFGDLVALEQAQLEVQDELDEAASLAPESLAALTPEQWDEARFVFAHALRVVRDCLALPASAPSPGGSGLARAVEFAARVLRRRAIVFVLSDFLTDGWRDALRRCARRHDVVAVRLIPPELADGGLEALAPLRLARVRDPESGGEVVVDFGHAPARAELAARIARFRERTEEELRRIHVDRVDVVLPRRAGRDAVVRPLLGFFRMRELRGAKR